MLSFCESECQKLKVLVILDYSLSRTLVHPKLYIYFRFLSMPCVSKRRKHLLNICASRKPPQKVIPSVNNGCVAHEKPKIDKSSFKVKTKSRFPHGCSNPRVQKAWKARAEMFRKAKDKTKLRRAGMKLTNQEMAFDSAFSVLKKNFRFKFQN